MLIDFNNLKINELNPITAFDEKVVKFITAWFAGTDTVPVQTSGSTGTPKVFEVEKAKMVNSARATCSFLGLKAGDSALLCLPVEYISGKMMVVRSIIAGTRLTVTEPSLTPLNGVESEVTFSAMTPLQVENSVDKLHLIRRIIIGGAAVSQNLQNKIHARLQEKGTATQVFETYGMSETLSHIALKEIYPQRSACFTVFDGITIGQDGRGCLTVSAPMLVPQMLVTNDIVEMINDKQFRFLGRADNVINSGGAKIFPEALESLVKQHLDGEAVFVGLSDDILGQKLVLVVEGEKTERVVEQLHGVKYEKSFHKPKDIIFIKHIPRTPNGKTDRRALLALLLKSNRDA